MTVLVNTHACEGKAGRRWQSVAAQLAGRFGRFETLFTDERCEETMMAAYHRGEREFIAAGGDGTINLLLNIAARNIQPDRLQEISIGAIGLGSSNDFQKPFNRERTIGGYPCRINFAHTVLHDAGVVQWADATGTQQRSMWINNASLGVTAEANYLFNHPPVHLAGFKRWNTGIAIVAAALETIGSYENIHGDLSLDDAPAVHVAVTNLGVVKNPNFSGSFCYDTPYQRNDGRLSVHLCEAMTKKEMVGILSHLSRKQFTGIARTFSTDAHTVRFDAAQPFSVEFDGETVQTRHARFSLIHNAVRICA